MFIVHCSLTKNTRSNRVREEVDWSEKRNGRTHEIMMIVLEKKMKDMFGD